MASDRMYELALQYRKTKLWQKISELEPFAIKLTDGTIGYCSIMSTKNEIAAPRLYLGPAGYQSYSGSIRDPREKMPAVIGIYSMSLMQDCLSCEFADYNSLHQDEFAELKDYANEHGIWYRGTCPFPRFLRYEPNRYTWPIERENEQQWLCECLEAAIALSRMLKRQSKSELGFVALPKPGGSMPLLERRGLRNQYQIGRAMVPEPPPKTYAAPELANDVMAYRVYQLKKRGVLECLLMRVPEDEAWPDSPDEEAPYYAGVLFLADRDTGEVLPPLFATSFEDAPEDLVDVLAETLLSRRVRPSRMLAGDDQTYALLRHFCRRTGIRLSRVPTESFGTVMDAADNFLRRLCGIDAFDEEDWVEEDGDDSWESGPHRTDHALERVEEISEAIIEVLMSMDDKELRNLPLAVVDELLMNQSKLPRELADRLWRLYRN